MLEAAYVRIAAAVADLAVADPDPQRHLVSIPNKIELHHNSLALRRDMRTYMLGKDGKLLPCPEVSFGREKAQRSSG